MSKEAIEEFWHESWYPSFIFPVLFVTSHPSSHSCVSRSTKLSTLQDQTMVTSVSTTNPYLDRGMLHRMRGPSSLKQLHPSVCFSVSGLCWFLPPPPSLGQLSSHTIQLNFQRESGALLSLSCCQETPVRQLLVLSVFYHKLQLLGLPNEAAKSGYTLSREEIAFIPLVWASLAF